MKRIFSACMVALMLFTSITVNRVSAATENEFTEIMSSESFREALKDKNYCYENGVLQVEYVEEDGNEGCATMVTLVPQNAGENEKNLISTLSADTGSNEKTVNDSSYGLKAYTKINYKIETHSGTEYVLISSVKGNWTRSDRSIAVKSQKVSIYNNGRSYDHGSCLSQMVEKKPTSSSWSYTAPSGWHAVSTEAVCTVGVLYRLELKRGGSTWSVENNNKIANQ